MQKTQFIDLERQQKRIRAELDKRIAAVLDCGDYILGKEVPELEEKLAAFTGARHCIACSSGSAGLLMAVLALDLPRDTPVFLPAFTFFASAEMPVLAGLKPVFVDIEPDYFQISPAALAKAVEEHKPASGVVLPVDLFGQSADYADILPIARKHGLFTLEDAAQAFGATYEDRKICNVGCDLAVTSFFPAKPLGCYGDGGAIFTNDDELASALLSIRVHGQGKDKYDNVRIGINGRLDTLQAAVLLAKLGIFEEEIKMRENVAAMYEDALAGAPGLRLPSVAPGCTDVWAQYCVLLPEGKRESALKALAMKGIPANIYYPVPLPYLQAFADLHIPRTAFPVASNVAARILALPFHPYLEEEEIQRVSKALREALQ